MSLTHRFLLLTFVAVLATTTTRAHVQAEEQTHALQQPVPELERSGRMKRTLADDDLREFVEFIRLQLVCGFPAANIPPLAPLHIAHKDFRFDGVDVSGNVSDFTLTGLDGFDIEYLHWNHFHQKVEFIFNYPLLHLHTGFKFDALWQLLGVWSHTYADGTLDLEFHDFRVSASLTLGTNRDGGLRVKYFDMKMQLGGVQANMLGLKTPARTKFFNAWLEELITIIFESEAEVSAFLERLIVPIADEVLGYVPPPVLAVLMMGLVRDVLPNQPLCQME